MNTIVRRRGPPGFDLRQPRRAVARSRGPRKLVPMPKTPPKHIPFFELETPRDLFEKMEGDLKALEASPDDSRLAFNFFVTAEHLPDWLKRRDLVSGSAILRVVSHLANGVKHFETDRHDAVQSADVSGYVADGYWEKGYAEERLEIRLSPDEAQEIGVPVIDAVELGRRVLDFWRGYVP
jgi:hypothetical protein